MRLYFTLVIIAIVVMALSGVGLAWDGSYALFNILDPQTAVVPYGRFTQFPLHWIVLQTSHLTSNLAVLRATFGIVYAAITLLALIASWWIVHRHASAIPLFTWAALGIGLGTLPGQVCAVCQSTLSVQLFYPIVLALLIFIPRRTIPVVGLCALAIFYFHPSALALLGLAAGIAFVLALRYRESRRRMFLAAFIFAALSATAAARFYISRSPYETGELSTRVLHARVFESLAGLPIVAMTFAWVAALLLLVHLIITRRPTPQSRPTVSSRRASGTPLRSRFARLRLPASLRLRLPAFPRLRVSASFLSRVRVPAFLCPSILVPRLIVACVGLSGLSLILWAADPHRWAEEVNFREMALFVALPFIFFAMLEGLFSQSINLPVLTPLRTRLVQLTGLIFFIVIGLQSFNWVNLTNRLSATMAASPTSCISADTIAWLTHTPLDHWSLTGYSLLIQSRAPDKIVRAGNGCTDESFIGGLPVAFFGPGDWDLRQWQLGWFDLHILQQQLTAMQDQPPACQFPLTWGWYGIERDETNWHRWTSGRATMRVLLVQDTQATLSFNMVSMTQPNTVDILVNNAPVTTLTTTQAGWHAFGPITLSLHAGQNTVEFMSQNPPSRIGTDTRELAIAIQSPSLILANGTLLCR